MEQYFSNDKSLSEPSLFEYFPLIYQMMLCCMLLIAYRLEIVNGFGKEHHQLANFSNRGVNGIDGTLSTALGIAHESGKPTFLLTGELAFLHDSNALLLSNYFIGSDHFINQ